MSDKTLGEYLRELREEKELTMEELADQLSGDKYSLQIITKDSIEKFEKDSTHPSREEILQIGRALRLDSIQIKNLMNLAEYRNVPFVIFHQDDPIINVNRVDDFLQTTEHFITQSGASMGGSIDSLGARVDAIENSLGALQNSTRNSIPSEVGSQIKPLWDEVSQIKKDIIPQLQQTQEEISNYDNFIRDNLGFLRDAVSAQGLMDSLQGRLEALENRILQVENQKQTRWERNKGIITIIVAAIAALIAFCGCTVSGMSAYLGYIK